MSRLRFLKPTAALVSALALCGLIVPTTTDAFDTGHHYDVARNALLIRGFNPASDAIQTIQVGNFMTDFNSLTYILPYSNFDTINKQAMLLHFNNLFNSTMIHNNWAQLFINQKAAIDAIVSGNGFQTKGAKDPLTNQPFLLLSLLGMSLHVIQDFYAHSNWITTYQPLKSLENSDTNTTDIVDFVDDSSSSTDGSCPLPTSIYDPSSTPDLGLHTYYYSRDPSSDITKQYSFGATHEHGGYYKGINKDSYVRKNFDYAYTGAFLQSVWLIDNFKLWIGNDQLWNDMLNFKLTNPSDQSDLYYGQRQAEQVSTYLGIPESTENDGHWKGLGSGKISSTVQTIPEFIVDNWQTGSIFARVFYDTNIFDILTANMSLINPATQMPFPPQGMQLAAKPDASQFHAITVRTWGAGRTDQLPPGSEKNTTSDFPGWFAAIRIHDQWYRESTQYELAVHPRWKSIKFVDKSLQQVEIEYNLVIWEDENEDKQANIKPDSASMSYSQQVADAVYNTQLAATNAIRFQEFAAKQEAAQDAQKMKLQAMTEAANAVNRAKQVSESRSLATATSSSGSTLTDDQSTAAPPYTLASTIAKTSSFASNPSSEANVPNYINATLFGLSFIYDSSSQQITSGLPSYMLNRIYNNPNHLLSAVSSWGENLAQVNLTVNTRSMCAVAENALRYGEGGEVGLAERYFPGDQPVLGTESENVAKSSAAKMKAGTVIVGTLLALTLALMQVAA